MLMLTGMVMMVLSVDSFTCNHGVKEKSQNRKCSKVVEETLELESKKARGRGGRVEGQCLVRASNRSAFNRLPA